ncbi:hypothetical protein V2I01_25095 [Micromonospora sp. BRA006-A]|nr:hypothetical protein [Micromonospora sp. BRA006-A]
MMVTTGQPSPATRTGLPQLRPGADEIVTGVLRRPRHRARLAPPGPARP